MCKESSQEKLEEAGEQAAVTVPVRVGTPETVWQRGWTDGSGDSSVWRKNDKQGKEKRAKKEERKKGKETAKGKEKEEKKEREERTVKTGAT